ncbi:MAG: CDP-diacylglycerol--glycerol-3-phosphate 3-phosphatidyltransferase [Clostridiales bacterium]|nr:CDP-diacylglycerol--glycerol-3-phosphate 3-phosphatidyltransferase [Clostridiales bacterium]
MSGKSALTLPTKITIIRLVMIPLLIASYCLQPLWEYLFIVTAVLFVVASMTDYVDGHIARKYNLVSDLGKLLDPIADKVLVATGLFILIDGNYLPELPYFELICSVIIIAREFMIGVIRQVAALKKVVLAADKLGKIKTASTMFSIGFLLCSAHAGKVCEVFKYLGAALLVVATVVTVISGANYIVKNKDMLFGKKQTDESESSGDKE